ncbi:MAG: hypothetical protein ACX93P_05040 [Roseovarius sp.]
MPDRITLDCLPRGYSLEDFEDLEVRFDSATEVIGEVFTELEKTIGASLGTVGDTTFKRLIIDHTPGVRTEFTTNGGVYYIVDPKTGEFLSGAAQNIPEAVEIVREICASNAFEGAPLPYSLRCISMMIILGDTAHLAKRAGPKLSGDFFKKWLLFWASIHAHEAFGLTLTRHKGPNAMSACDAASLVASQHGICVTAKELMDWCTHTKYQPMRARARAFIAYYRGQMLRDQGIITSNEHPFGPLQELAMSLRSDNLDK